VKKDLLDGNAVVVFAYGLSGSGKTYTVFGFDDAKNKGSWFYQENNNPDLIVAHMSIYGNNH